LSKNNLKIILVENGITNSELSRASGRAPGTISKICNNKYSPAPTTKSKIVLAINELSGKNYSVEEVF